MTHNTKTFDLATQHNVLVIIPNGDSLSFRDLDIQREGIEIKNMIASDAIRMAIVDLNRSNYFGSLIIGVINSIGQSVKANGGQMVLCNASPEMEASLKIMRLDRLWPLVADRATAIKLVTATTASM